MNKKTLLFVLAVLLQIGLLLMIPIPRWIALTTGKTIVLETAPVDPYAIFQGYYARLNYKISQPSNLPFKNINPVNGRYYYVILSPTVNGIWESKRIVTRLPQNLPLDEVALKGKYRNSWMMEYGIEQYYLPENQRSELEKLLQDRNQKLFVTMKVGPGGQGAIIKLRVGRKEFVY